MNIQDKLKQTQGQSEMSKFRPTRLSVKRVEDKPVFRMWDGEKNVETSRPLKGIFLGQANQLEGFDGNLGPSGGSWVSSYYVKNDQTINLYAPGNSKPHHKGTKAELQGKVGSGVALKSRKILFFVTEKGLFAVNTNMTLAIGQLNRLGDLSANLVTVTPMIYDPADQTIPPETHKFLDKAVVKRNPPLFASIEKEEPIGDIDWMVGDMTLDEVIDEFNKFQKRIQGDSNESGEPSQDIQKQVTATVDEINAELAGAVESDKDNFPF